MAIKKRFVVTKAVVLDHSEVDNPLAAAIVATCVGSA